MISYEPLFKTMKARGITSYRLGKMGFPLSNFNSMRNGKHVSTRTLDLLCKILNCDISDILEVIHD
jgi:DNA-binding Xre family transcriptional regulator